MARMDPRWWRLKIDPEDDSEPDEEDIRGAWKRVIEVVRHLDNMLEPTKLRMARAMRLYDPTFEMKGAKLDIAAMPGVDRAGPVILNVVKSAVDTVSSMIAKNQPRATFLTDDADYTTSLRADELQKFCEGEFQRTEVYDDGVRMFRDGTTAGLGVLRVDIDEAGERPVADRVLPWDCVWDEAETYAAPPRQFHQLHFYDRDLLAGLYPNHEMEIAAAPLQDRVYTWNNYRELEENQIVVVESWHMPSSPGAKDGVHSVVCDGATLLWEEWNEDYIPFVFFRWAERITGFVGCPLPEELAGLQNRINKVIWHITKCHDLANSYILVQSIDHQLQVRATGGSDPLKVIPYKGTEKPQFVQPPLVQPELYSHLMFLIQQSYKIAGISELNATSQVPAQLESSLALNTYNDINTQRFSIQAQRYERAILEVARMFIRCMERHGKGDITVNWRSGNLIKKIKWSDVHLDRDIYVMHVEAASIQSRLPSGRMEAAIALGNSGLLNPEDVRDLVGNQDIDRTMSMANAAKTHGRATVEKLERGVFPAPEPLDNLPVVLNYVTQRFWILKDRPKVPPAILDLFREWIRSALDEIKKKPPMDPAGMMAAPMGPAQGGPGPKPQINIQPGAIG